MSLSTSLQALAERVGHEFRSRFSVLSGEGGSSGVGAKQLGLGALPRSVLDKYREFPTDADWDTLQRGVDSCAFKELVWTGVRQPPAGGLLITKPVVLRGLVAREENPGIKMQKASNDPMIRVLSRYVDFQKLWLEGSRDGRYGFIDTTDLVVWGQNDGNNNTGTGYIDAQRGRLFGVTMTQAGRDGFAWQEGAHLKLDDVHVLSSGRYNFCVSDKAFDASHGIWNTHSIAAESDGYNVQWGCHTMLFIKSMYDKGRGLYLNQSYGSKINLFAEHHVGRAAVLDTLTGGNVLNVQHFQSQELAAIDLTSPKRNTIWHAGTGGNAGASTLQLPRIGSEVEPTNVSAASGGVELRGFATSGRSFDARASSVVTLGAQNRHISHWIIGPGSTVNVNGDPSSHPYNPDGDQDIHISVAGNGSFNVEGYINGSYNQQSFTGLNKTVRLHWYPGIGWFVI